MMIFRARHSSVACTGDRVTCLNVNAELSLILTEQNFKKTLIVLMKKKTNFGKSKCPGSHPPRT